MKNKLYIFAAWLALSVTACKHGTSTSIKTSDGEHTVAINYSGRLVFDSTQTRVVDIEPNGYLTIEKDGDEVGIHADSEGKLSYEVNGHRDVTKLNDHEQQLIAEAIKTIVKENRKK